MGMIKKISQFQHVIVRKTTPLKSCIFGAPFVERLHFILLGFFFLQQLNSIVLCQIYHHILFFSGLSDTTVTLVLCQGAEKDLSLSFTFNALPFYYDRYFFLGLIWKSLIYSCQNQERRVLQNPRWRWDKKRRKRRKKNINDSDFNRESAPFM